MNKKEKIYLYIYIYSLRKNIRKKVVGACLKALLLIACNICSLQCVPSQRKSFGKSSRSSLIVTLVIFSRDAFLHAKS